MGLFLQSNSPIAGGARLSGNRAVPVGITSSLVDDLAGQIALVPHITWRGEEDAIFLEHFGHQSRDIAAGSLFNKFNCTFNFNHVLGFAILYYDSHS